MVHGVRCMRTRGSTSSQSEPDWPRRLRVKILVFIAIDAFEICESLGVRGGVGFGRFAAGKVGEREADVEESSDAS